MTAGRVRPIIVLGPERSGTSAWAELVVRWGAYPGEQHDLPEPDRLNPHGRWEYGPLWDLLERIGGFADGVSWWDESFPAIVAAKARDRELRAAAEAMTEQMEQPGLPWVWKDPALCHFLPFWRQIWRDPVYVIAIRHPLDVARSWQQFARSSDHRPTSVRCNLLRWQYMASQALQETDTADQLFVEYEQLAQHPEAHAARLALFLDNRCGTASNEAVIAQMAAACDGALWRNRDGYERATGELAPGQADLYSLLRRKAAGLTGAVPLRAMPDDWRSVVTTEEAATHRTASEGLDTNRACL
jgi:hypothetical protein